tara:strand:- start:14109 stop:14264 length:156 start_codon:yes stop_codon:yes gene_type:complete
MPFIVDPSNDSSNGVGRIFKSINFILAISLPIGAIITTLLWGAKHGFNHFI